MSNANITHQFISAYVDSPDSTQVQPSNWNAAHLMSAPSVLSSGDTGVITGLNTAGVLSLDAVKSSGNLQYLRRNLANTAYEFATISKSHLVSSDYDFVQLAPVENLSPSLKTFTLAPVPLGVNGTDVAHYLGIFNNAGVFQEAILISGGSATSGAATGTITATTISGTYASGAYKIGSISSGLGESFNVMGTHGIVVIDTTLTIYKTVTIPVGKNITIVGKGSGINQISRSSSFTAGDMFVVNTNACLTFRGLGIEQGVFTQTGSAIHGDHASSGFICLLDVQISNGQYGIIVESCQLIGNLIRINNTAPAGYKPVAGMYFKSSYSGGLENTSNISLSDVLIASYPRGNANQLTYGILCDGSDGVNITNLQMSADNGIYLNPSMPTYITNWQIEGFTIDGPTHTGVVTTGTGLISAVNFNSGYINGPTSTSGGPSSTNNIAFSLGGNLAGFRLGNFRIDACVYGAIAIGSTCSEPTGIVLNDISISNANTANNASQPAVLLVDGAKAVSLNNIRVFNSTGSGKAKFAVQIAGAASDCTLRGIEANLVNDATSSQAVIYNTASVLSKLLVTGINDAIAATSNAITAAAALALGTTLAEYYIVSGTTGVTSFLGIWEGRKFTLLTTSGAVVFTAGATIGNTFTSTQNKPVNCIVTGGKVYLS